MKLFSFVMAGVIGLLPLGAGAQDTAPDALVKNVSTEVLEIVRSDPELRAGNTRRAVELVEKKVLPHFNFQHMTALAVGKDWRQASPPQQRALVQEFKTLLVRTYSNAFTAYRNQTVEYKPFKMQAGDSDATVRTQITQPGGKPLPIDYSLEKTGDGWKVYDVSVGGVSLVTNYRESFAQEVRNNGIDGLIKALQAKNRSLEATAAARSDAK